MTTEPPRSYTRIAIAVVIAGVVIGAAIVASSYLGPAATVTSTSTVTTTLTTSIIGPPINAPTVTVNGSLYYADNTSKDFSVGNPGYSYFFNGSVTFLGVKFVTYCPPSYQGCPVPPGVTVTATTTMGIGAIRLNATFPDKSAETMNGLIGDNVYFFVFSHHSNPQAGILIVYSGSGTDTDKVYLLVS